MSEFTKGIWTGGIAAAVGLMLYLHITYFTGHMFIYTSLVCFR